MAQKAFGKAEAKLIFRIKRVSQGETEFGPPFEPKFTWRSFFKLKHLKRRLKTTLSRVWRFIGSLLSRRVCNGDNGCMDR